MCCTRGKPQDVYITYASTSVNKVAHFGFKNRGDITRNPKQWPYKKDKYPPKIKKERSSEISPSNVYIHIAIQTTDGHFYIFSY